MLYWQHGSADFKTVNYDPYEGTANKIATKSRGDLGFMFMTLEEFYKSHAVLMM